MQTDIHFWSHLAQFLLVRNAVYKSCTENQNTHFVFSDFFFENRTVCEIMWENMVERGRPQMAIWRMRAACWIPKATNTHSEYVILTDFSTSTMVTRTRLSVTSCIHCVSRLLCYHSFYCTWYIGKYTREILHITVVYMFMFHFIYWILCSLRRRECWAGSLSVLWEQQLSQDVARDAG